MRLRDEEKKIGSHSFRRSQPLHKYLTGPSSEPTAGLLWGEKKVFNEHSERKERIKCEDASAHHRYSFFKFVCVTGYVPY